MPYNSRKVKCLDGPYGLSLSLKKYNFWLLLGPHLHLNLSSLQACIFLLPKKKVILCLEQGEQGISRDLGNTCQMQNTYASAKCAQARASFIVSIAQGFRC